jgi:modulator of FtsH protease
MLEGWSEFFVAAAGAAAALAGLIIVAMSVSIDDVVKIPGMTSRAATAIAMLVLVTAAALAGLIPSQSDQAFGIEVLVLSLVGMVFALQSLWVLVRHSPTSRRLIESVIKAGVSLLPFVALAVGAVLVIAGVPGGVHLIAFGSIAAFMAAVIAAWVMLVEIRR